MRTSRTARDSPRASGVAQIDSYPYSNRIGAAGCCGGLSIAAVGSTGFHSAYSAVILLAHGTERWMPRRMRCRRVYIERRAECTGSRRYRRHFESWNLANSLDSNASRRLDLCEAAFPPYVQPQPTTCSAIDRYCVVSYRLYPQALPSTHARRHHGPSARRHGQRASATNRARRARTQPRAASCCGAPPWPQPTTRGSIDA